MRSLIKSRGFLGAWAQAWGPGPRPGALARALEKPLDLRVICSDSKARTGLYGLKGPFPGLSPWAQGPRAYMGLYRPIWAGPGLDLRVLSLE